MTASNPLKMLFSTALLAGILCTPIAIGAQENAGPELILRVKPSLCLRYSSGEECKLTVEVVWRDESPNDYCLHSVQDEQPVQCWENLASATLEEERAMQEDLVYWLSYPGEEAQLVVATIEMATVVDDDKRNRTRRRHVWNLI